MSIPKKIDVAVIGGGIAGLIAATRAGQLGLSACVLEKGAEERYLCNTRYTGGTLHVCLQDIMTEAPELRRLIEATTQGNTPPAIADVIANEGRRVVRWLQGFGIRFMKASPAAYHNWVLAPPRPPRPGLEWEGRGGDVMMRTLADLIGRQGGSLVRGARARGIVMRDGRCTGVEVEFGGARTMLEATAVVIADGGFQGNPDLLRGNITPKPEALRQRGAGTALGDGLLMARAAGARITALDGFYGHVLPREALSNDMLWPYPVLDSLCGAGIAVDGSGRRFADEGEGGVWMANSIARLADPLSSHVILDDAIWNGTGKSDLIPPNPNIPKHGGTIVQADTLDALAAKIGLPAESLAVTVRAYNDAVAAGTTAQLTPPRRADKAKPQPIVKAPFIAIPMCAGITYTMGGIATNEDGRVLATDGAPIEGLYAAGSCVGGVDGGPAAGYIGGLVKGGVLGLRSAEHLARSLGKAVA